MKTQHQVSLIALAILVVIVGCKNASTQKSANERKNLVQATKKSSVLPDDLPEVRKIETFKYTKFVLTGADSLSTTLNTIYSPTFLAAWNELTKAIGTTDGADPLLHKLDVEGANQAVVNATSSNLFVKTIKIERLKIKMQVKLTAAFSFAYPMDTNIEKFTFNKVSVKAFGMPRYREPIADEIQILYYKNDSKFIIQLIPKDGTQNVILAMGFNNINGFGKLVDEVQASIIAGSKEMNTHKNRLKYNLLDEDIVLIPKLSFNIKCDSLPVSGKMGQFKNGKFFIEKASQQIGCILNERGAKVESTADIAVAAAAAVTLSPTEEKPHPKHFVFDKPFFVMFREDGQVHPYFAISIQNAELMQKAD